MQSRILELGIPPFLMEPATTWRAKRLDKICCIFKGAICLFGARWVRVTYGYRALEWLTGFDIRKAGGKVQLAHPRRIVPIEGEARSWRHSSRASESQLDRRCGRRTV